MKIKVPLFVTLPRKTKKDKKVWLNINIYRNLHYIIENQCKESFFKQIQPLLPKDRLNTLEVSFQLYKCKRKDGGIKKLDKSNVYAVLSKYFFDSLVLNGNIPDDNDQIIKTEVILPTEYLEYGKKEYAVFNLTKC